MVAVLVAFNTVRLTIVNQRQEIEIMRLVGATNAFIRSPFLLEGALKGFLGGALIPTFLIQQMPTLNILSRLVPQSWATRAYYDVIARGREYLKNHLGQGLNSPETHAYMVYALASTGGAPKAAVDGEASQPAPAPAATSIPPP